MKKQFIKEDKNFFFKSLFALFTIKSIKKKIIYTCMILLVVSSLIICFFSVNMTIKDKKSSLSERMEAICVTMIKGISAKSNDLKREVELIANSNELGSYITTFDENYISQLFIDKSDLFYEISYINTFYEEELKVLNGESSDEYAAYRDNKDFIRLADSDDTDYIYSDEFILDDTVYIRFFYKLKDEYHDVVGFLSGVVKINFLIEDLILKEFEKAGFVYAINQQGKVLNHINKDNVFKVINEKNNEKSNIVIDIRQLSSGFLRADIMGVDGWIYYMPHEDFKWSIIATLPYDQFIKPINKFLFSFVIIVMLSLIGCLFFVNLISNKITKGLRIVTNNIKKISEGQIFALRKVELKQKDEIGVLAESFNLMLDSLTYQLKIIQLIAEGDLSIKVNAKSDKDVFSNVLSGMISSLNVIVLSIKNSAIQVSAGSSQVAQASQSLSQGATEQASTLEEITSSITEISSQAKQNANNADHGNNQMKELVSAMGSINKSADDIKKIIKVIDDIAFQTNLLALNANVEAARAGKYGKGFAVVAEEVRNLASRSSQSVKETTTMVEETIKNIKTVNDLVETTAKQLEEIVVASEEQRAGLSQINSGLGPISQITQANTANAEESSAASEELASQAQQLEAIVSRFILSDNMNELVSSEKSFKDVKEKFNDEVLLTQDKRVNHQIKTKKQEKLNYIKDHEGQLKASYIDYEDIKGVDIKRETPLINPDNVINLDDQSFGKF